MVMLGQPFGTLTQALEQHLAVPHRAECEPKPAGLGAEGIDPFRVEQRGEGAQVRAQLAGGDASLVNRLRVAAGADQGAWRRSAATESASTFLITSRAGESASTLAGATSG